MLDKQPEHSLLLRWLMLTGLLLFAITIAWHEGIIMLLYEADKSRISWVISLIYFLITLHCAKRIYALSMQANLTIKVSDIIEKEAYFTVQVDANKVLIGVDKVLPDCFMTDYIRDLSYRKENLAKVNETDIDSDLMTVYESRLKGPQEIGWFISDIILKLGLIGTIFGFILMLGSVTNITDFDVSNMQKVLRHMSDGMGTALYTTLAGLICSILSTIQYHMLDRHADQIMASIQHFTSVHMVDKPRQAT